MDLLEFKQPVAVANIIINEAIELSKCFAEKDAYKFINGILDEAAKVMQVPLEGPADDKA
jgi:transcription termination factor NusB